MFWKPRERVEPYQEQLLRIALNDGRIQAVYAGRPLIRVDAEILDLDEAQVSDDAELRFLAPARRRGGGPMHEVLLIGGRGMQNMKRMRELIQTITEADEAYYKYDSPIMADLDYDRLYDKLAALERETGIILASSPTQRVSGKVLESLTVVRHTRPMLSADKRKSVADIHSYLGGRQAVLSWKLDGLTLVLRYENGKLQQAISGAGPEQRDRRRVQNSCRNNYFRKDEEGGAVPWVSYRSGRIKERVSLAA